MPVLNGIEAAKRMLEANPSTKIVFLTVEKDKDTCRAVLELGACGTSLRVLRLRVIANCCLSGPRATFLAAKSY